MRTSKPGKSVYLHVGVWYNEETGNIHLTARDVEGFHTTVNGKTDSVRGHPNLFAKLAGVLKNAGAPHPEIDEEGSGLGQ